MRVKFNNISLIHNEIEKKVFHSFKKIINKNDFILSSEVSSFEMEFADFCNAKYAVGCGNGYDALFLAIKSLNLEKDSEVIVPAMTFAATAYAVINAGLKLVLIDVDENGLIDLKNIDKVITNKTKLIIPVHLYGQAVNMFKLNKLKKIYGFKIIEDCAQAHGAFETNSKKQIGCLSDIACYSFYPGKNLGAFGDAGAMVTNNKSIYNKLKSYRALGSKKKYIHDSFGINSRLDSLQAAVLRVKLKYLKKWNLSRIDIGKKYLKMISFDNNIRPINTTPGSVFHIFNIIVPNRKKFIVFLKQTNIEFIIHYPSAIHEHKGIPYKKQKFKNAEIIAKKSVSLPIYPYMDKAEINYVIEKVNEFIKNY